jgi:hypothetical protein
MEKTLERARQLSLALLVIAVLNGHPLADYTGTSPSASGLTRLARDITRRARATAKIRRASARVALLAEGEQLRVEIAG